MSEDTTELVEISQEVQSTSEPSMMRRVGRVVFRTLITIIVGLALGMGLYYGSIRLYREAIEPIQNYEDRISELERSLDQVSNTLESENIELHNRQAGIEGRLAEYAEAVASVEALVQATQQDLRDQRRIISSIEDIEKEMEELTLALGSVSTLVEQLEIDVEAGELIAQQVQRTAVYLRAMSMLTRAQLELDRDNLGFAAEQVVAARETLGELINVDPEAEASVDDALLATILERLDLVLLDLPTRPKVAADELEAVWKLFMEALQPVQLEQPETGGE
jgi:predicted RNase H-like nuclease (RuvC/YqgF family)